MSFIRIKALAGFVWLMAVTGAALFMPAGTLLFPAAWAYLIVFFGAAALITVYLSRKDPALLERRLHAGPMAEKEKSQKALQSLAGLFFLGIFLIAGFDHRAGWSQVPLPLVITGDLFVALGFLIVFFAFRENSYTSAVIEVVPGQTVISTGPYGVVRHPMYSGALLLLLFTPPALGSFCALLVVAPLIAVIVLRLLNEEKTLSRDLPGYREYCLKVRHRLIPAVW